MLFSSSRKSLYTTLLFLLYLPLSSSQSYSSCNPLTQGGCPADPALARSVNIDFTQGASDSFTASGYPSPSYGSNGAAFTIQGSGDSPTLTSIWYIMFGHVDFVLKAAPGTGIVSSAILQSDDLDEIDLEWLGGDDTQVQSNYFGKGETVSGYNRGAFHGAPNNHDQFTTYSIDWTADQIVWSVAGQTVRVLTPDTAEANQYPQTPMRVKVGIWAGGDPSNAPGTIQWAGGETDYQDGPFTMYLQSIHVTDYSTGSSYSYSGTSGTWESIVSNGGKVNPSGQDTPAVASQPAVSTASGAPIPFSTSPEQSSIYATRTGFPWVLPSVSTSTTSSAVATSYSGLPSGWIITSSGKVVPPSTGPTVCPSTSFSSASVPASTSDSPSEATTAPENQPSSSSMIMITTSQTQSPSSMSSRFTSTSVSSSGSSQTSAPSSTITPSTMMTTTRTGSQTTSSADTTSTASHTTSSTLPQAVKAANSASTPAYACHFFKIWTSALALLLL